MKKAAIIGIDGAPFELIASYAEKGVMPRMANLIRRFGIQKTSAPLPEISPVSWISLVTGMNPGEHGVFGFTELDKRTYTYTFPNFPSLPVKTIWESPLQENDLPSLVVNLPHTYPVRPMNGVLVSGFVAVDIGKAVFPLALLPKLREINYRFDPDFTLIPARKKEFLTELRDIMSIRYQFFQKMLEQDWGFYTCIITETDRLNHFFFNSYENENDPWHGEFLNIYREVDRQAGELAEYFEKRDIPFILVSDHGFTSIRQEIYLSQYLKEWGYLQIKPSLGAPHQDLAGMSEKTSAFCLDPSRIYIHRKDKYPRGMVSERQAGKLSEELKQRFLNLEYEGRRVMAHVFAKEEIYRGPHLDKAPDLILVSNDGFDLKSGLTKQTKTGRTHFEGMHSHHNAFLIDAAHLQAPEGCMIAEVGRRLKLMREADKISL